MSKSKKLPAIHFYSGDWKKDLGVQALDFHDRHVWFEMLLLMHDSESRGELILNNKPMSHETIARLIGLDNQTFNQSLTKIIENGVCGLKVDGTIFSRKMVREEEISRTRIKSGSMGGNPILVNQTSNQNKKIGKPNAEDEDVIEDEVEDLKKNCQPPEVPLGLEKCSKADFVYLTEFSKDAIKKRFLDEGLKNADITRAIEFLDLDFTRNPEKRYPIRDHYKDLISWPLDEVKKKKFELARVKGSPKSEFKKTDPPRPRIPAHVPAWLNEEPGNPNGEEALEAKRRIRELIK